MCVLHSSTSSFHYNFVVLFFLFFLNISGARCLLIENVKSAYTDFTRRLNVVFLKQMNKNSDDVDDDYNDSNDDNNNNNKHGNSNRNCNIIQNNAMNYNNNIASIAPFLPIQSRKCGSRAIHVLVWFFLDVNKCFCGVYINVYMYVNQRPR